MILRAVSIGNIGKFGNRLNQKVHRVRGPFKMTVILDLRNAKKVGELSNIPSLRCSKT